MDKSDAEKTINQEQPPTLPAKQFRALVILAAAGGLAWTVQQMREVKESIPAARVTIAADCPDNLSLKDYPVRLKTLNGQSIEAHFTCRP
jgi:hypothetical protein